MNNLFVYNERLGIALPTLVKEWDEYEQHIQEQILLEWESIRGSIPDRIKALEVIINRKQDELSGENDFDRSCELNFEIAELASIINDLWIWYRTNQDINEGKVHT
jgi:hypothetical protein